MAVHLQQAFEVGKYLVLQRLKGKKHYPLVLMLEPLFRCNLACTGCGKIQHPVEVLKQNLSPEQCFSAVEECGAPVVSIPGGEPLLHPEIDKIVEGLVARKKFVYLCTNGLLLEKSLDKFKPSPYLTLSIHLDGLKELHDQCVDRNGVFDTAIAAIKAAKAKGFRVTTNTTTFEGTDPKEIQRLFDYLGTLGVDGMMISPGYNYEWAPDQDHFLAREQTHKLFKEILAPFRAGEKSWNFNHNTHHLTNGNYENKYDYPYNETIFHSLQQYKNFSPIIRYIYKLFRNPFIFFTSFWSRILFLFFWYCFEIKCYFLEESTYCFFRNALIDVSTSITFTFNKSTFI
jgi:hopanoid biosynthesis associated radical SAM protein HpnH